MTPDATRRRLPRLFGRQRGAQDPSTQPAAGIETTAPAPPRPRVFEQHNEALGDGRVFAVQDGDMYVHEAHGLRLFPEEADHVDPQDDEERD
jgi:hypothetical protein